MSLDLADDAIQLIERFVSATSLREQRNAMIRRAALLYPAGGPYTRAGWLLKESATMNRTWNVLRLSAPPAFPSTPRECLHVARLLASLPESQRQFHRVLIEAD